MTTNTKALILAGLLIPGAAFAQFQTGDVIGTTEADIRAAVEAQGYTVSEIEFEDGEIEVQALLDGLMYEIEVAADTGLVVEIELDDDDCGDDDDEDDDDEDENDG